MNTWIDFSTLPKNLKHWSLHVTVCSIPSFIIAYNIFNPTVTAIVAMCSGILTFLIAYTLISSTHVVQRLSKGPLGSTILHATRTRSIISLISLPLAILANTLANFNAISFCPDYWAGYISGFVLTFLYDALGLTFPYLGTQEEPNTFSLIEVFASTYIWVILEGLILSATLISFIFFFFALQNTFRKKQTT